MPAEERPVPGKHAAACGKCGSPDVEPHCPNPRCTWVRCRPCNRVTDTRKRPGGTP